MKKPVSETKAKKILKDDSVKGRPLTKKQKGFFGLIAGGGTPRKMKKKNPSAPYGSGGCYQARGKIGVG